MANTLLTKNAQSVTNAKKYTVSFWCKKALFGINQYVLNTASDGSNRLGILFNTSEQLEIYGQTSGSENAYVRPTRLFRDPNAFYHFVIAVDTTQSTAADRMKIYVNGTLETVMTSTNYPSQNADLESARNHYIGGYGVSANYYFGGVISHFHFVDGTQYAASDFGSTDSTTGEWQINTAPSVTYGSAGYFILKDGNSVTDQSGNSNNFAVSTGTLTSTKDCPSNVYCVWNRLVKQTGEMTTIGNGNTYLATQNDNTWRSAYGTIGFQGTGKFYAEFKCGNLGGTQHLGIIDVDQQESNNGGKFSDESRAYAYVNNGQKAGNGSQSSYGNSWDSGNYLQIAYNNGAIWFGKDGTWQNSATISEINAGTTTNAAFTGIDTSKIYTIGWSGYADDMIELNAGNGWFRTTEVGSPNNPSSGDTGAKFKYTVPTAYQPISTKGLNE